jgi:hypothetical protein
VLFSAQRDGQDVALALFNRRSSRFAPDSLFLGESGERDWDGLYVEHNGILSGEPEIVAQAFGWLARKARLVLSGVESATLQATQRAGVALRIDHSTAAPFLDLRNVPPGQDGPLAHCSANTRYQLRRSARLYAEHGPLHVTRADSVQAALHVLDELAQLHQTTWIARGRPGAFANPHFLPFHRALIARALPRDEVDLLRITAGDQLIGCLYNFRYRGEVLSYQSGFAYSDAGPQQKPGLTSHHLALVYYRDGGLARYNFLAGEDRYKLSLAGNSVVLHWLDVDPRWSLRGILTRMMSRKPK